MQQFWNIENVNHNHSLFLKKIADEILVPIYGSQDKAYKEWFSAESNKKAFVSVKDGNILGGFLSLKLDRDKPYLKIATLLTIIKGQGCGITMLNFAINFAKINNFNQLLVTVSEKKPESISFFKKNGFELLEIRVGKYQEGVGEYVLLRSL